MIIQWIVRFCLGIFYRFRTGFTRNYTIDWQLGEFLIDLLQNYDWKYKEGYLTFDLISEDMRLERLWNANRYYAWLQSGQLYKNDELIKSWSNTSLSHKHTYKLINLVNSIQSGEHGDNYIRLRKLTHID